MYTCIKSCTIRSQFPSFFLCTKIIQQCWITMQNSTLDFFSQFKTPQEVTDSNKQSENYRLSYLQINITYIPCHFNQRVNTNRYWKCMSLRSHKWKHFKNLYQIRYMYIHNSFWNQIQFWCIEDHFFWNILQIIRFFCR